MALGISMDGKDRNLKHDYVVIGGGIAGLCAALRLTELGVHPLIIEAGDYPSHKLCGEFISSGSISLLERWNINPVKINDIQLVSSSEILDFQFPFPAGSLSHMTLDVQLAERATTGGAELLTRTKVVKLGFENGKHVIHLSSGETVYAGHLIVATGRLPALSQCSPKMKYIGIKAHFEGIPTENKLIMFSFNGSYLGLSPIEDGKSNIACLAELKEYKKWNQPEAFIQSLRNQHPLLDHYLSKGKCVMKEWMTASIPEFGIKETPDWPQTYFIGDALATIPPITGNGLSMAMEGGMMAAEYAICNDVIEFKKAWKQRFKRPVFFGKILHQVAMNPSIGKRMMKISNGIPKLKEIIFNCTR
jgi:flavin-dependent dehydrogenase